VQTHTNDVATTGVVVSARPLCVVSPSTETFAALHKGSGLPVFAAVRTYGLVAAMADRTRTSASTSKAVITQDPQPTSGEQLRKHHPPV
jgi:hypothetical protein